MRIFQIILFCLGYTLYSQQPSLQFAKQIGQSTNEFASGKSVKTDRFGNIYSAGGFYGAVDFDPSPSAIYTVSSGDAYISKLDNTGNFIWTRAFQTNGNTYFGLDLDMAFDSLGNVFVAGAFSGTVDLDPGPGIFMASSTGGAYVTKLDSNGNFLWSKVFSGNSSYCNATSMALDTLGNILLTGHFYQAVDFDPSTSTYTLMANTINPYILKLDPLGNFLWVKQIIGDWHCWGRAITTDRLNNIYTSGGFQCIVDFDPSPSTYTLDATDNFREYVCKFDDSGNLIWAKHFGDGYFSGGGAIYNISNSIRVDAMGNVYTAGSTYGKVDFDPGPFITQLGCSGCAGMYISKLSNVGNLVWAKEFVGSTYNSLLNSIELDNSSNVYAIGEFISTFDFDPGTSSSTLTAIGQNDVYIAKLDQNGAYKWAFQIGDTSWDVGNGVYVDRFNYVYSTGKYRLSADFDPGNGTLTMPTITHNSFVQKLCQGCVSGIVENVEANGVIVFPNPAKDEIEIICEEDFTKPKQLRITDILGKEVYHSFLHNKKQKFDVSNLQNGVYLITIKGSSGESITKKVIVSN